MNYMSNAVLRGRIASEGSTFTSHDENFFSTFIEVPRLSGTIDTIPITVPAKIMSSNFEAGKVVTLGGEFRSYNKLEGGKTKLELYFFVTTDATGDEDASKGAINRIDLVGNICKKPTFRATPFGRQISDLMIAVNRSSGRSFYIPCVAWSKNAEFCSKLKIGDKLSIVGRIQNREYVKKDGENVYTRTAYEVSVFSVALAE